MPPQSSCFWGGTSAAGVMGSWQQESHPPEEATDRHTFMRFSCHCGVRYARQGGRGRTYRRFKARRPLRQILWTRQGQAGSPKAKVTTLRAPAIYCPGKVSRGWTLPCSKPLKEGCTVQSLFASRVPVLPKVASEMALVSNGART